MGTIIPQRCDKASGQNAVPGTMSRAGCRQPEPAQGHHHLRTGVRWDRPWGFPSEAMQSVLFAVWLVGEFEPQCC